jgi:hypothetical protein
MPTKAEMIELVRDPEQMKISILNDMLMSFVLQSIDTIYSIIRERNWYIGYIAKNKEVNLVTSDQPVLLYWNKPGFGPYSPGFALESTTLTFSICPKIAIMSEIETRTSSSISLRHDFIREINKMHVLLSNRYIYSKTEEFFYNSKQLEKVSSSYILE